MAKQRISYVPLEKMTPEGRRLATQFLPSNQ